MPKKADKSSVSVWSWFITIIVSAIPCIGFIYVICGALFANNESRRNYFKAQLVVLAIILIGYGSLFAVGFAPDIKKIVDQYRHEQAAKNSTTEGASSSHKKSSKKPAESD